MAKNRKQGRAKKTVKPRGTDVETASEYATIEDLKRKALVDSENERE